MGKQISINESALKGVGIKGCISCPACGKVGMYVYENASGDLNYKCPTCHRKCIVHLDDTSTELLEKDSGAVNESFIPGKSLRRIHCGLCNRMIVYVYEGASGHINIHCMHRKCFEKLVVDLDNRSSKPLNEETDEK
ncbi:MAG: hypothetical protein HDQ99_10650 [Lachnospiraceae bacterium]|nr:hypothetical protein [Lachnospiraceae bacterium]